MLTPTTDARFTADVLEADVPVVVDFHAAWCPPCRVMHPILDAVAEENPQARFLSVDTDDNHATAVAYSILSMPTLLVFRGGQEVLRLVGARPRRRLEAELADVLQSPRDQRTSVPSGSRASARPQAGSPHTVASSGRSPSGVSPSPAATWSAG
jgi:thioredoxin 1